MKKLCNFKEIDNLMKYLVGNWVKHFGLKEVKGKCCENSAYTYLFLTKHIDNKVFLKNGIIKNILKEETYEFENKIYYPIHYWVEVEIKGKNYIFDPLLYIIYEIEKKEKKSFWIKFSYTYDKCGFLVHGEDIKIHTREEIFDFVIRVLKILKLNDKKKEITYFYNETHYKKVLKGDFKL